jgi:hypothetical protein
MYTNSGTLFKRKWEKVYHLNFSFLTSSKSLLTKLTRDSGRNNKKEFLLLFIIMALKFIIFVRESPLSKDVIELRLNITFTMKAIKENCSDLMIRRYPHLKNLSITCPHVGNNTMHIETL